MLKLFFIIGVFIGSLINLTDTPDTEDKKDNEEILFFKKEIVGK